MSKLVRRQCLVYLLVASLVLGSAWRPVKVKASFAVAAVPVAAVTSAVVAAVIYAYFQANGLTLVDTTTSTGSDWDIADEIDRIVREYNATHSSDLFGPGIDPPGPGWEGNLFMAAGSFYASYKVCQVLQALADWYKAKYYIENDEEIPVIEYEDDGENDDPFTNGKIRVTVANPPSGTTYKAHEGDYEFSGRFLLGDDGSVFVLATGTEGLNSNVSILTPGTIFGSKSLTLPSGKMLKVEFTALSANGYQDVTVSLMDEYGLSVEASVTYGVSRGTGTYRVARNIEGFYLCYMLDTLDYRVIWYGTELSKTYADYYVCFKTDVLELSVEDVGAEVIKPSAEITVAGDPDIPALEDDGHSYMEIAPSTGGATAEEIADAILSSVRIGGGLEVSTGITDGTGWDTGSGSEEGGETGSGGGGIDYTDWLARILDAIKAIPGQIASIIHSEKPGDDPGGEPGDDPGGEPGDEPGEEPSEGTPEEELDKLGLDDLGAALVSRFPFCIPWDVAAAFKLLAAEPETPKFEVDFFEPIADVVPFAGSTKLVLDFEEFAVVGRVSRWASTIGFLIALAVSTKRLIWTA